MSGYPIDRVTGPDGDWVFTLYQGPHGGKEFVHALDTAHRFAMCINIPRSITRDLTQLRIRRPPTTNRSSWSRAARWSPGSASTTSA